MRKKSLLLSSLFVPALAIGAVALFKVGSKEMAKAEPNGQLVDSSITIDANNPSSQLLNGGQSTFKSVLGNNFDFYSEGITIQEGKYVLQSGGFIRNISKLDGIYRIAFHSDVEENVTIGDKISNEDDYSYKNYYLTSGLSNVDYNSIHPSYFDIRTYEKEENISFTSFTIYYSCVADSPVNIINEVHRSYIEEGISTYDKYLYANIGENLLNINLVGCSFDYGHHYCLDIEDANKLNIVSISYLKLDSTTVVVENHEISMVFEYDGETYQANNLTLFGYDHYTFNNLNCSLQNSNIRQKDNDNLPDDLIASVHGSIEFLDSHDDIISSASLDGSFTIQEENVVAFDKNPFTAIGNHTITLSFKGNENQTHYTIYNPEICNIQHIYYQGGLEIEHGATKSEFLAYIANLEATIWYFEDDESYDHNVILGEENFPNLDDNSFSGISSEVSLDVEYGTYIGTIGVQLIIEGKGEPTVYTAEGTVTIIGVTVTEIVLYEENNVIEIETLRHTGFYTLDGTKLTFIIYEMEWYLTINTTSHTFTTYEREDTPTMVLMADLTALGSPDSGFIYETKLYEDNTLIMNVMGMAISSTFTFDENDSSIIYFEFTPMQAMCKGVIDAVNLTLLVTLMEN